MDSSLRLISYGIEYSTQDCILIIPSCIKTCNKTVVMHDKVHMIIKAVVQKYIALFWSMKFISCDSI